MHVRFLKKLGAILAVVLLLHTQAAWACAEMVAGDGQMEPSCCTGHHAEAAGRMADCEGDPSAEALCAKPYTAGTHANVVPPPNDGDDNDHDFDDGKPPGTLFAVAARVGVVPTHSSAGPPLHHLDPDQVLGSARLTYLDTLRLRI